MIPASKSILFQKSKNLPFLLPSIKHDSKAFTYTIYAENKLKEILHSLKLKSVVNRTENVNKSEEKKHESKYESKKYEIYHKFLKTLTSVIFLREIYLTQGDIDKFKKHDMYMVTGEGDEFLKKCMERP